VRYRIKIITYQNGRKEFEPQVKRFIGWATISFDGTANRNFNGALREYSREEALERIDLHFSGNTKKQTIEIEYINK
jgi:hypothetical protein